MRIQTSDAMADRVWEQTRFPRSKKKRIRRKWKADPRNWRIRIVPWDYVFTCGNVLWMHPAIARKVQDEITRKRLIDRENCLSVSEVPDVGAAIARSSNSASVVELPATT
jgi:hypothetical protein